MTHHDSDLQDERFPWTAVWWCVIGLCLLVLGFLYKR